MKKRILLLSLLVMVLLLMIPAVSAEGNITFDGIPTEGAWVYSDCTITIPISLSNYTTGLSAFRLVVEVTGASAENPPVYTTTSGGYVNDTDPYYSIDTWCFAYNETNSTVSEPQNRTVYNLTHAGISVYGGPFGNESVQIGMISIPLENTTALTYITLHAYMTEAYDAYNASPVAGDSGSIILASRPYPQRITYYNNDTGNELGAITGVYENRTYGNVTAYVYADDRRFNLYNASLGDTIVWSQIPHGGTEDVVNFTTPYINPTLLSGINHTGTAYLHTVINFTAPTVTAPSVVVFNHNETKFWMNWTGIDYHSHRVQTGSSMEYMYVLEIPADFSLKQNGVVTKTVRVLDSLMPDDEQLNVYVSSQQYDNVGNTYTLYYVADSKIKATYVIDADGVRVERNNQRILTVNSSQKDEDAIATLGFSVLETPEEIGTYHDRLTFTVNFTKVSS